MITIPRKTYIAVIVHPIDKLVLIDEGTFGEAFLGTSMDIEERLSDLGFRTNNITYQIIDTIEILSK